MSHEVIMVVEDDNDIRELLNVILTDEGYSVVLCESAEVAESALAKKNPSLMLLDLMLPGKDGLSFCKQLKSCPKTELLPIIIVSARSEESKIVSGLELGADDYITKPFSTEILLARVRAVLRRAELSQKEQNTKVLVRGDASLDIDCAVFKCGNISSELTAGELKILELLMRRAGVIFSRSQIVDHIHGNDYPVTDRAIDVMIAGLRRKMADAADRIETVRGIGYRWKW